MPRTARVAFSWTSGRKEVPVIVSPLTAVKFEDAPRSSSVGVLSGGCADMVSEAPGYCGICWTLLITAVYLDSLDMNQGAQD